MGIISKFFEALLDPKAATWSAGVSFNRSNPLPLDKWSVFQSMDAAVAYAETNAVAYPGQVIAVYHNGKMVAYVLSEVIVDEEHSKLALEPIGVIPTGEGAIEVTEDGVISIGVDGVTLEVIDGALTLVGFEDAPEGAQLVKAADGTLSWVKPDTTTVEGLATAVETLKVDIAKLEQQLNPTDEEGNPVEGGLVSDVADLESAVGEEAVYGEDGNLISEATGIFKDIEDIEDKIGSAAEYDDEGSLAAAATGLYAELDNKANKTDVENALALKADKATVESDLALKANKADVEKAIEDIESEMANKADAATVTEELNKKANAADVYTKDESDEAAEAIVKAYVASLDHLERKIVVSTESIDVSDEDADRFIYMVPNDRGSYDEYMVINGALEKVGDWNIDLSDYATIEEVEAELELKANAEEVEAALELKADKATVEATLAEKADAEEVTAALAEKADKSDVETALAEKANKSDVESALALKANSADVENTYAKKGEVQSIEALLNGKVDAIEGSRLMSDAEGAKLAGIAEGAEKNFISSTTGEFNVENGELKVNAIAKAKVTGLVDDLTAITNALATKVEAEEGSRLIHSDEIAKLHAIKDFIQNVDTAKFTVDDNGKLFLNSIEIDEVVGLVDQLAGKVDKQDGERLITEAEAKKLAALNLDGEEITISGTVNASQVKELYDIVVRIVTGDGVGLFDDVQRDLLSIDIGAEKNYIASVNQSQLIVENRNLSIKAVEMDLVTGLNDALATKATTSSVTNLEQLLNTKTQANEARIAALEGRLVWQPLVDENI